MQICAAQSDQQGRDKRAGTHQQQKTLIKALIQTLFATTLLTTIILFTIFSARAVANRTDACFIRVIGSELVQKYVGEGARMVRELFEMARTKKACLIFFDEVHFFSIDTLPYA